MYFKIFVYVFRDFYMKKQPYYAHVKDLCLKYDCSIRVYSLVLLEYISSAQQKLLW